MEREITCYETNKLDTLKFIEMCKNYKRIYEYKKMLLPEVGKEIWKIIQEDVFNVANSEIHFNELINDIGCFNFFSSMYSLCYLVDRNEEDYIYYRNFENIDCISLIGKPIYEFMNKIEGMLPYED